MPETAALTIWNPTGRSGYREIDPATQKLDELLLVSFPDGPDAVAKHDRITLHRAATLNGIADNLLHEDPSLDAEPWYDQLGRIEDMRIDVTIDGNTITLACPRNEKDNDGQILWSRRADRIVVRLDVCRGETVTVLELPADLAIDGDQWGFSLEEAGVLATADSGLEVPELQALLEEAFFTPSYEEKDGSFETQAHDFHMGAHVVACDALLDEDHAIEEAIRYAVEQEIGDLLPDDQGVDIRYRPTADGEEARIEVQLRPLAPAEIDQPAGRITAITWTIPRGDDCQKPFNERFHQNPARRGAALLGARTARAPATGMGRDHGRRHARPAHAGAGEHRRRHHRPAVRHRVHGARVGHVRADRRRADRPRRVPGVDPALGRRRAAGLEARRQLAGGRLATDRAPRRRRPRGRRTAHRHDGHLALRPGLPEGTPPGGRHPHGTQTRLGADHPRARPSADTATATYARYGTGGLDIDACLLDTPAGDGTGAETTGPTGRPARATKAGSPPAGPAATAAGRPTRRWTPRPPAHSTSRPETAAAAASRHGGARRSSTSSTAGSTDRTASRRDEDAPPAAPAASSTARRPAAPNATVACGPTARRQGARPASRSTTTRPSSPSS